MIKHLIWALLTGMMQAYPVYAAEADGNIQYNVDHNASAMLNDAAVRSLLKSTLANDYDVFMGNFDVLGEPKKVAGGGLMVEGWLKDLYLENNSVFVIYPDGTLYAAWVVPESNVIHYKGSRPEGEYIQPDIAQWADQFKDMHFLSSKAQGESKEVDYFNTDKFTIEITTFCENSNQCNDATYYGKRIKDGAELTLKGKAERALCDASPCPPLAFKFRNGNVDYILSKIDNSLTVIENNKIILAEKGAWYKQTDNPSSFSGKWHGERSGRDNEKPESTMSLRLTEKNGSITGEYCLIYNNGNRIDCTTDNENNISGYVVGNNKVVINFYTWFGEKGGKAEVYLDGNKAIWKLLKRPTNSEHYIPESYEYVRE